MALQPDGEQLVIGHGIGVERGQPVDLGTEDFARRWRDDLKLRSGHSASGKRTLSGPRCVNSCVNPDVYLHMRPVKI